MKIIPIKVSVAVMAMAIFFAGCATDAELAKEAKITLSQATAIALKLRPGTIADSELEKEVGGSGLRYTFDIKSDGKTYEVGVDAADGTILENGVEGG